MLSEVWSFLLPFIKILMSQAGRVLATSALKAVTIMASRELNSDAKRAAAVQLVKVDLANAGLDLATSAINAAIEAAYLKFKVTR
jgi:hypothetical protein